VDAVASISRGSSAARQLLAQEGGRGRREGSKQAQEGVCVCDKLPAQQNSREINVHRERRITRTCVRGAEQRAGSLGRVARIQNTAVVRRLARAEGVKGGSPTWVNLQRANAVENVKGRR